MGLTPFFGPLSFPGFAFPLGMDWVRSRQDGRAAWYWAINGALSVIATVMAMIVSFNLGIRATFWIGIGLYLVAGLLAHRVRMAPHGIRK